MQKGLKPLGSLKRWNEQHTWRPIRCYGRLVAMKACLWENTVIALRGHLSSALAGSTFPISEHLPPGDSFAFNQLFFLEANMHFLSLIWRDLEERKKEK